MGRILLVGGGCLGRELARGLVGAGHLVRITTRSPDRRAVIEAAGAECWLGSPARLGTLRAALEQATAVGWLMARAGGPAEELRALHGSLLEAFLVQTIDTTVRGFVYDASSGFLPQELLRGGALATGRLATRNAIPHGLIEADLADRRGWLAQARSSFMAILEPAQNQLA